MKIANLSKAACECCKNKGRIFYNNKWWCGVETYEGEFNIKGYCKGSGKKSK